MRVMARSIWTMECLIYVFHVFFLIESNGAVHLGKRIFLTINIHYLTKLFIKKYLQPFFIL